MKAKKKEKEESELIYSYEHWQHIQKKEKKLTEQLMNKETALTTWFEKTHFKKPEVP
jgi:hypothetical protein